MHKCVIRCYDINMEKNEETNEEPVELQIDFSEAVEGNSAVTSSSPEEEAKLREIEQRKKRVAAFRLRGEPSMPARNDWRKTVGMFRGDAVMKEIAESGRKLRESRQHE